MTTEHLTTEAVALLQQLVAVPRTSRNEREAADLYGRFLEAHGLRIHREANNVWTQSEDFDSARPTLLLNAHLDTVKAASAWSRDPLRPCFEGDRLYGLGTNDDGASLVALTQAFRVLVSRPQNYNLILLASAEEEVSGRDGIERALPLLPRVDVALVGEPTGMQPAVAEKGLMVLDVTAHGKAGHAARNEGVNAIYRAMDDISWFRTYHFPEQSALLGPVKMSVTIINAGSQHNVVPDECRFTVDVRSNECYSNEQLFDLISASCSSDVKARSFRLNSSSIDPAHPLV
ncbi:MAG: M20/M25/M40 family metallo-hydrolase, partial [Bacteroidaceae bacterium]|nr:M20/M25/M40 family metallo-hydrolase [Bacteroidaceae bacterium]